MRERGREGGRWGRAGGGGLREPLKGLAPRFSRHSVVHVPIGTLPEEQKVDRNNMRPFISHLAADRYFSNPSNPYPAQCIQTQQNRLSCRERGYALFITNATVVYFLRVID